MAVTLQSPRLYKSSLGRQRESFLAAFPPLLIEADAMFSSEGMRRSWMAGMVIQLAMRFLSSVVVDGALEWDDGEPFG